MLVATPVQHAAVNRSFVCPADKEHLLTIRAISPTIVHLVASDFYIVRTSMAFNQKCLYEAWCTDLAGGHNLVSADAHRVQHAEQTKSVPIGKCPQNSATPQFAQGPETLYVTKHGTLFP